METTAAKIANSVSTFDVDMNDKSIFAAVFQDKLNSIGVATKEVVIIPRHPGKALDRQEGNTSPVKLSYFKGGYFQRS